MKSLLRKLQAITDGKSNQQPHKVLARGAGHTTDLFYGKIISIKRKFNLNMHPESFYLAHTAPLTAATVSHCVRIGLVKVFEFWTEQVEAGYFKTTLDRF
jgi:hypothetical protein